MTATNQITRETVHANWDQYVQSPSQLASSRFTKFPPGREARLVDALDIKTGERILEIGCGLGILASRLLESGQPETVVGVEVNSTYLQTTLPDVLRNDKGPLFTRADGFDLPFPDNSFDRLLTHTVVNLLEASERKKLHDEARRVLTPGGWVSHMDGLGGESWSPDELTPTDSERHRKDRFFELLTDVHEKLGSGFVDTAKALPRELGEEGFEPISVNTYSSTLRLSDPHWSKQRRRELLTLRRRAEDDRVERLRNLLDARDELTGEREDLLDQYKTDRERHYERRRERLERNRELGWRSSLSLVINAKA